jgi:hypothetical protein
MSEMWTTIAAERGALADDLAGLSDAPLVEEGALAPVSKPLAWWFRDARCASSSTTDRTADQ